MSLTSVTNPCLLVQASDDGLNTTENESINLSSPIFMILIFFNHNIDKIDRLFTGNDNIDNQKKSRPTDFHRFAILINKLNRSLSILIPYRKYPGGVRPTISYALFHA